MPKQTMPVFYINKTKFKPQVTGQKRLKKDFSLGDPICITLGFNNMGQKQPPEVFYKKRCSYKFRKIHNKLHAPFFNKVAGLRPA